MRVSDDERRAAPHETLSSPRRFYEESSGRRRRRRDARAVSQSGKHRVHRRRRAPARKVNRAVRFKSFCIRLRQIGVVRRGAEKEERELGSGSPALAPQKKSRNEALIQVVNKGCSGFIRSEERPKKKALMGFLRGKIKMALRVSVKKLKTKKPPKTQSDRKSEAPSPSKR